MPLKRLRFNSSNSWNIRVKLRALYEGAGHASRLERTTLILYGRLPRVRANFNNTPRLWLMGGSVQGLLDSHPRAASSRGGDNAAVVTCISMASSGNFISAAVLDISRKATAVKERVDCIIGRLHSCTQNLRISSCNLYCRCVLAVR